VLRSSITWEVENIVFKRLYEYIWNVFLSKIIVQDLPEEPETSGRVLPATWLQAYVMPLITTMMVFIQRAKLINKDKALPSALVEFCTAYLEKGVQHLDVRKQMPDFVAQLMKAMDLPIVVEPSKKDPKTPVLVGTKALHIFLETFLAFNYFLCDIHVHVC
jgi:hypothetical protein